MTTFNCNDDAILKLNTIDNLLATMIWFKFNDGDNGMFAKMAKNAENDNGDTINYDPDHGK